MLSYRRLKVVTILPVVFIMGLVGGPPERVVTILPVDLTLTFFVFLVFLGLCLCKAIIYPLSLAK